MLTRTIGKILRGKATPFQLVAACTLGAMIGFAPGFLKAPALWLLLLGAMLIVNANLGLALLVAGASKLLALLLAPLSYEVGRFLLDGPLSGAARWVVNARVLAWCGLQYYAVSGAQLLGLVLGLVAGVLIARAVTSFRKKMAAAEAVPGRVMALADNKAVQAAMWLFFGGKGKETWAQKTSMRGNPVRIPGLVLVVLALGGGWLSQSTLLPKYARRGLKSGLQAANGAQVDVGAVELDLTGGCFAVDALAMADPENLGTDLLRAGRLEADVDEADLLRRRMHVKRVLIQDASSGLARETPAQPLGERKPRAKKEPKEPKEGVFSIEDVLAEAEVWRGRLEQVQSWLERLRGTSRPEEPGAEPPAPGEVPEAGPTETLEERLAREVREKGWFGVQAGHLVDQAPTFRLGELAIEGLQAAWLPGRVLDVHGRELSTHPWLIETPPKIEGGSRDGALGLLLNLAPVSKKGGKGKVQFHWKGLAVDDAMRKLKLGDKPPLKGGTLDLEADGGWLGGRIGAIDLELRATFRGSTLTMGSLEPTQIAELVVPIGLKGPLDDLSIHFDGKRFANALAEAGKSELANKVRAELEDKLGGKLGKELEKLDLPGDAGGLLEGVLGGNEDKKKKGGKKKKADGGG